MLRDNIALHKLAALAIATTVTTSFWVLVLTAVSYAFGITISSLFLVGFGLAIAVASGLGVVSVMGLGSNDASGDYTPSSRREEIELSRGAGGVVPRGSAPNR